MEKKISITQTAQLTDEPKEKMESVEVDTKLLDELNEIVTGHSSDNTQTETEDHMEEFKEEPDETSGQKLETKEKEVSADNDSITVFDEDILSQIKKEKDHPDSKEEFQAGILEITVKRARDLVDKDNFSKSDPYVTLRYKELEFRSETISNNLNPEWNFASSFEIQNEEEKYIHINVYDDDFGRDNIQGCISLPLELAMNQLTKAGQWFRLVGSQSGEIFLSTQFNKSREEPSHPSLVSDNAEVEIVVFNTEEPSNLFTVPDNVELEIEAKTREEPSNNSIDPDNDEVEIEAKTTEETFYQYTVIYTEVNTSK